MDDSNSGDYGHASDHSSEGSELGSLKPVYWNKGGVALKNEALKSLEVYRQLVKDGPPKTERPAIQCRSCTISFTCVPCNKLRLASLKAGRFNCDDIVPLPQARKQSWDIYVDKQFYASFKTENAAREAFYQLKQWWPAAVNRKLDIVPNV